MSFRADESARAALDEIEAYFIPRPRDVSEAVRRASKEVLMDLIDELGPPVSSYPSWHPIVSNHSPRTPVTTPGKPCGYAGLDHTRYFRNGFITCPYGDGGKVIDSVRALPRHEKVSIEARRIDAVLYNPNSTPIVVSCDWGGLLDDDGLIPLSLAAPLFLERELPCWRWAELGETWETMRPYILGMPHGSLSSHFVSQKTGLAIKKIWNSLIYTGMFGPIKV